MLNQETVLKEQDLKEETSDGHQRTGDRKDPVHKCAASLHRFTDAHNPHALRPLMMSHALRRLDDISVLCRVSGRTDSHSGEEKG